MLTNGLSIVAAGIFDTSAGTIHSYVQTINRFRASCMGGTGMPDASKILLRNLGEGAHDLMF